MECSFGVGSDVGSGDVVGLMSTVLTPLILAACHSDDATGTKLSSTLVWTNVLSGTTKDLVQYLKSL